MKTKKVSAENKMKSEDEGRKNEIRDKKRQKGREQV